LTFIPAANNRIQSLRKKESLLSVATTLIQQYSAHCFSIEFGKNKFNKLWQKR